MQKTVCITTNVCFTVCLMFVLAPPNCWASCGKHLLKHCPFNTAICSSGVKTLPFPISLPFSQVRGGDRSFAPSRSRPDPQHLWNCAVWREGRPLAEPRRHASGRRPSSRRAAPRRVECPSFCPWAVSGYLARRTALRRRARSVAAARAVCTRGQCPALPPWSQECAPAAPKNGRLAAPEQNEADRAAPANVRPVRAGGRRTGGLQPHSTLQG